MKFNLLITIAVIPLLTGCLSIFDVTPRVETVVDTVYVPKECPTFTHILKIDGKKYKHNESYNETMIVTDLEPFLESLERNKLARQTFNAGIKDSNKVIKIEGIPETSNFDRIEKRIYVNRTCPKYTFKPQVKAKKLTNTFNPDKNVTYVVITLDNMVLSMEKHKLAKETYNNHIDDINALPFTEAMKKKFDTYVEITVDKINDTAAAIKEKATEYTKEKAVEIVKEKTIGN